MEKNCSFLEKLHEKTVTSRRKGPGANMVVGQGGAVPHHQPKYPLFAPPSKSLPHNQNFEKSIKHKPNLRWLTSIFQKKIRPRRLIQFVSFSKLPQNEKMAFAHVWKGGYCCLYSFIDQSVWTFSSSHSIKKAKR